MQILGMQGLSNEELRRELDSGGKFVVFQYAISLLVVTFRRTSAVHFVRSGESAVVKGLPYTMLSLLLGWWGIPWGLIWTPMALVTNFSGGRDVTPTVRRQLLGA